MERKEVKQENKNPRGRPPRYLSIERFERFLTNDFWHLKVKVNAVLWVVLAILTAIIVKWVMG